MIILISILDLSQMQNDSVIELDVNKLSPTQYKKLKEYIFTYLKQEENKLYHLSDKLFKDISFLNKREESLHQSLDNKKSLINNIERDNINDYNKNKVFDSNISANNKIENKFNINQNINSNEVIYNNYIKQKSNEFKNIFYNPMNSIYQVEDNKIPH